jgi:hypothetical protein
MKKIFFSYSLYLLVTVATAQQDSTNKQKNIPSDNWYCATIKNGNMVVTMNDKPLVKDVKLKNGNRITASGMIIKKDGTMRIIEPGNCVNADGNDVEQANKK